MYGFLGFVDIRNVYVDVCFGLLFMDISYCFVVIIGGVEFSKLFVWDWWDIYGGSLIFRDCDVFVVRERECLWDCGVEVK